MCSRASLNSDGDESAQSPGINVSWFIARSSTDDSCLPLVAGPTVFESLIRISTPFTLRSIGTGFSSVADACRPESTAEFVKVGRLSNALGSLSGVRKLLSTLFLLSIAAIDGDTDRSGVVAANGDIPPTGL